jgi:anti-anti-sigma regulatory factor
MTFKMEKSWEGRKVVIRLVGRVRSEHLEELKGHLGTNASQFVLDLTEVTLVDVDVVRFLGTCECEGVTLLHCSPYIREWILREQREPGGISA